MPTEISGQIYIKTLHAQNNIFKKGIPNMRFLLLTNHGELKIWTTNSELQIVVI